MFPLGKTSYTPTGRRKERRSWVRAPSQADRQCTPASWPQAVGWVVRHLSWPACWPDPGLAGNPSHGSNVSSVSQAKHIGEFKPPTLPYIAWAIVACPWPIIFRHLPPPGRRKGPSHRFLSSLLVYWGPHMANSDSGSFFSKRAP